MPGLKSKQYTRHIFKDGSYATSFRPDSTRNPFKRIYAQKRSSVIEFVKQHEEFRYILDIGGGMARIASVLNSSLNRSIICADISMDMLKMGLIHRRLESSLEFVQTDAHRLPFEDQAFNCIIALDLFCHLEKPKKALQELYRVLTDHGRLVIDSTNSIPLWTFFYPRYMGLNPLKWLKIIQFKGVLPGWEDIVNHYTRTQFHDYLSQANFKIEQNTAFGPRICPKWHLAVAKKSITSTH